MRSEYADIQVVVFDFKGVGRHLRSWLDTMANVAYASEIASSGLGAKYLIGMRRNIVAQWFLEESTLPWLLMVNDTIIPLPSIKELLDCKADVAACHVFSQAGREGHGADGDASTACMKISRTALERIPRPWFKWEFNTSHTKVLQCDCGWFCKQAKKAGFLAVKAGMVAHLIKVALIPPQTKDGECRMKFLHQIEPFKQE